MRRRQVITLSVSVAAGVTGVFVLGLRSGARRRALVRDKVRHYTTAVRRRLARTVRVARGRLQGLLHSVAQRLPGRTPLPLPDGDAFVEQRVRTALGREPDLPLGASNIDAVDGVVRVRGTVSDAQVARKVVEKSAAVPGARAVLSLLRTPDGTPVGGRAGDLRTLDAGPRAAIHAEQLRQALRERWPALTDLDIVASEGHIAHLALLIWARTGEPEDGVRATLERIVQASV